MQDELVARYGAEAVIARLAPLVVPARLAKLERVAAARRTDVTVLLERFYDPHNYAAVLRSAEGFGLTAVHAIPGKQGAGYNIDISRGAQKWITFARHHDFPAATEALSGYMLVGADAQGVAPEDLPRDRPLCLVMGAEKAGLSAEVRARCEALVGIEMSGFVESFNVSVAAALLLQRLLRHRPPVHLAPAAQRHLLACYLVQSVGRAETVLRGTAEETE
jgi:tRNA (guanosine-2'-O-)-methyltransferase